MVEWIKKMEEEEDSVSSICVYWLKNRQNQKLSKSPAKIGQNFKSLDSSKNNKKKLVLNKKEDPFFWRKTFGYTSLRIKGRTIK